MRENDLISTLSKYDTPVLSDALDKLGSNGGCSHIVPRSQNTEIAGRAFTVKFEPVSPGMTAVAGDYIDDVPPGSVIVIDNSGLDYCTTWGDILTIVAQMRNLAGTVIDGACRDLHEISGSDYPVFSRHAFMQTGKNRIKLVSTQNSISLSGRTVNPGDYVRADKSGVLVIPQGMIEGVLSGADIINRLEEQIKEAVRNGSRLDEARRRFKYNDPLKK